MNEIYFKQMPVYSTQFMSECIEMYSFDRIAHTVNQAIIDTLTGQGWTPAAAVEFIRSKAMRHGLDQNFSELLEKAAKDWLKLDAESYRADCHQWAEENAK